MNPSVTRVEEQYAKAQGNTRFVKFLKFGLPTFGVFIILGFIAISYLNTVLPEGLVISSSTIEDGKIVMNQPILAGQNGKDQPYRMKADRAIQEIGDSSVVTLENIEAQLPMSDGEEAVLIAEQGIFNQTEETLVFDKPLQVTTSSGMIAKFPSAKYDIGLGNFISDGSVDIKLEGAQINADKMVMSNNGQLVSLEHNVKMIVNPSAIRPKEPEARIEPKVLIEPKAQIEKE
jgi:lipopolysaccharide export system protein LptC